MNKATERLKEIEKELKIQKKANINLSLIACLESEKQGILLGLEEGRKEVIENVKITQEGYVKKRSD